MYGDLYEGDMGVANDNCCCCCCEGTGVSKHYEMRELLILCIMTNILTLLLLLLGTVANLVTPSIPRQCGHRLVQLTRVVLQVGLMVQEMAVLGMR